MIKVSGLTKDYGARRAITNVSFDAQQGEIVGFLGPNGAGKTTTLRILAGYMPPTDGEALVAGYDVVEESLDLFHRAAVHVYHGVMKRIAVLVHKDRALHLATERYSGNAVFLDFLSL
jgi:ABC-type multidrug transport system ATPase subunit